MTTRTIRTVSIVTTTHVDGKMVTTSEETTTSTSGKTAVAVADKAEKDMTSFMEDVRKNFADFFKQRVPARDQCLRTTSGGHCSARRGHTGDCLP